VLLGQHFLDTGSVKGAPPCREDAVGATLSLRERVKGGDPVSRSCRGNIFSTPAGERGATGCRERRRRFSVESVVTFLVRPVSAAATYCLRQRILRPHQDISEVAFTGDADTDAGHFAAYDPVSGEIVGVATVLHEPPPATDELAARAAPDLVGTGRPDDAKWWRLRGMAAAEQVRNQGVGTALVAAVITHAANRGGTRLWCYARLPAVAFYRAVGFQSTGEPWEETAIGPHIAMWRPVP
jgi:GNAT superfamily N-acetyltransferase